MKAILQTAPGGTETLYVGEVDQPQVAAGELLVRLHAAGVNRADIVQREGRYPPPPGAPTILGLEVSGTVAAVGEQVSGFAIGDAVFGLVAGGAYAEYACLEAALAIRKPQAISWEAAASLPEAWMTAWFNLVEIGKLQAGQTVLIHAGASGVGSAAIQLGTLLGARVIATAGTPEKCAHCLALGAAAVVNYREQADFQQVVKADGGADLILDCVGASYLARNIASLRTDGMLIVIGAMSGREAGLDLGQLLVKRLTVRGSTLRVQPLNVKAPLAGALRDRILPMLLEGKLSLNLDRSFSWQEVAAAHRYMEDNLNLGKVVLSMHGEFG